MARVIKFEGRNIVVPDDATDDEVATIIDGSAPAPQQEESNWYDPDRLAANPLTRFATGAASPVLGAMEMIPGDIGAYWAQKNKAMSGLVEEGKKKQDDITSAVGNVAEFGGTMLSPAFLKLAKALPAAKTGADLMKQGAVIGAAAGLTSPTGKSGNEGAKSRLLNA